MAIRFKDYRNSAAWIDRDQIKAYLSDIKEYEPLSRDEELELIIRIKQGDERARELLVLSNLRFVIIVAKHFTKSGLPIEDIISEGNYGLVKAADRIDVERLIDGEAKFITYAVHWVTQSIYELLNRHSRQIRLPVNVINNLIKERDGLDEDEYADLEAKLGIPIVNSLNTTINEDGDELSDFIECTTFKSPDDFVLSHKTANEEIMKAMGVLSDREREILIRYFGLAGYEEDTLETIADSLTLTRERVRQIKEAAIRKLRHNPSSLLPFI